MNTPDELLYSKEHEWLEADAESRSATLGITDYAQDQLGDVVYVELPDVGASVGVGESLGSLESVKAVSEVYSPVSAEITEVNEKLADSPETINDDPYGEGWIVKLKLSDAGQLDDLMSASDYATYVEEEGES